MLTDDWGAGDAVVSSDWGHGDEVIPQNPQAAKGEQGQGPAFPSLSDFLNHPLQSLGKAALNKGTRQVEAGAGEMVKGVPIAGAYAPQTPDMTQLEQEHPDYARGARAAGALWGTAPLMMAAPEVFGADAALPLLDRTASGIASSTALQGADTYARTGDVKQAAQDARTAGTIAGIATPAASVAGAFISPELQPGARELLNKDVPLTPGQMLGGNFQRLENVGESVPFVGRDIAQARTRSIEGFNRAAANDALEPIAQTLPEGVGPGYEARNYVRKAIGDVYDAAIRNTRLTATPQMSQDIATAQTNAVQQHLLPQAHQDQLRRVIEAQINGKLQASGGTLDGEAVKGIDSELNRIATGYRSDPSFDNRNLGNAIEDVRQTFKNHVAQQNPLPGQAMAAADNAWAHYTRLRQAGSSTAVQGTEGIFTPTQLQMAVKSGDQTVGKRAMSEGDALYQDLAQAGKTVLPNKVPDSGTPERIETLVAAETLLGALGHPGAAIATGAPIVAAKMAYQPWAQNIARALIAGAPETRGAIADTTRAYGPQALLRAIQSGGGIQGNQQ